MLDKNVGDALLKLDLSPQTDRAVSSSRTNHRYRPTACTALDSHRNRALDFCRAGGIRDFCHGRPDIPGDRAIDHGRKQSQGSHRHVGAKAADEERRGATREPLDEPYTPLTARQTHGHVHGIRHGIVHAARFRRLGNGAVASPLTDSDVSPDQREPAADFRTAQASAAYADRKLVNFGILLLDTAKK